MMLAFIDLNAGARLHILKLAAAELAVFREFFHAEIHIGYDRIRADKGPHAARPGHP